MTQCLRSFFCDCVSIQICILQHFHLKASNSLTLRPNFWLMSAASICQLQRTPVLALFPFFMVEITMFLPLKSSDISVVTAVTALVTQTASLAAVQSKSNCNNANSPRNSGLRAAMEEEKSPRFIHKWAGLITYWSTRKNVSFAPSQLATLLCRWCHLSFTSTWCNLN